MINTTTTLPVRILEEFPGAGPGEFGNIHPDAKGSLREGLAGLGRGGSCLHADGLKLSDSY
jgi:hypothetical protein